MANALVAQYPLGGFGVSEGAPIFHPDFFAHGYTQPTQAEIDTLVANYTSLSSVRARKLAEIKQKAGTLYNEFALYVDTPEVIKYGTALRAIPTTAQAEMAILTDVTSVRNYHPIWPTKPNF